MRKIAVSGIIIAFMLLSCATTTGNNTAVKDENKEKDEDTRPLWISKFPQDDAYYIGIGASDTGNAAEDRKIAEERARAAIAAAISTKIHEEVNVVSRENSLTGTSFHYAEDRVSAEVEQSLKGVETVDTYSSESSGTWVYMRLSKALWEKTQKEEMDALINRITGFLAPVLDDYNRPLVTRIQQLVKARDLILDSPYPGMLKTVFYGEKGSLIDIIDTILKEHVDALYLNVKPVSADLSVGDTLEFSVEMSTSLTAKTGSFPFVLTNRSSGNTVFSGVTGPDGKYSGELKYTDFSMGINNIVVSPDGSALKIDFRMPEKEMIIDLQGITIGLNVSLPEGKTVPGIKGAVTALFSRKDLPFKVDSGSGARDPMISFEFIITDYPRVMEGAPDMAKVSAVISLIKDGKTVYSFESRSVKDGGLTPDQAHERAVNKLMKILDSEDEYVDGIMTALSLN